jgi:uncharacterized protein
MALIAVSFFALSSSFLGETRLYHKTIADAYAQPYVETVKLRNLILDLDNGIKTNAQLTIPAIGEGPFPGVLIIPGSGAIDMNGTEGLILVDNKTGSRIYPTAQTYFQIAEYLSERGFVVLRYDKRGIGSNNTILDSDVWGNLTFNNLKQDAERALTVLLQQPEVNATKKATLIGHSEGTTVTPRVAVDNPDKVNNIILMSAVAQNLIGDILYFQVVETPPLYAEMVLDKTGQELFSLNDAIEDPIFPHLGGGNLLNQSSNDDMINIKDELRPAALAAYENLVSPNSSSSECQSISLCPIWANSHITMDSTLDMIGNVSSDIGILIQQGENDSQTPVEQGLLLQQRLTEVNHPNHLLITYPNLGHVFAPSNQWITAEGPVEDYVIQDMFEWLVSPPWNVNAAQQESNSVNKTAAAEGLDLLPPLLK